MVARNASPDVWLCSLRGVTLTRPIIAVTPAGYRSRPARAMLEVLEQVSREWQATGRTVAPVARTRAA
jgi:hypothetical protein